MRCTLVMLFGMVILAVRPVPTSARQDDAAEATVIGIASVDIATVWDAEVFTDARTVFQTKAQRFQASILRDLGVKSEQIQRITLVQFKTAHAEGETLRSVFVFTARQPIDVAAFVKATDAKRVFDKGNYASLPDVTIYEANHKRLAVTVKQIVSLDVVHAYEQDGEKYKTIIKPQKNEEEMIVKALKRDADRAALMAKDDTVVSASFDVAENARLFVGPPDDAGNVGQALPPSLQPLMKARFLAMSVSLKSKAEFRLELSFADADTATATKPALEGGVKQLSRLLDETVLHVNGAAQTGSIAELAKLGMNLLDAASITAKDKSLVFMTSTDLTKRLAGTLAAGVLAAENAASRSASQNNLKQIALAGHNLESANAAGLLQNICDDKGKPLLSWRVKLLPYLEMEPLYNEFKLDEPWDSEHNKKLIAKMPKIYIVPTGVVAKEGHTFYQAFVGKKGKNSRPLFQDGDEKSITIAGITDGSSNTLMVAEAGDAVEWTKPEDMPFDGDGKLPKLGGHFEGGFNVAFCDGSVRFLKATLTEETIKALITANGGETIALDDD